MATATNVRFPAQVSTANYGNPVTVNYTESGCGRSGNVSIQWGGMTVNFSTSSQVQELIDLLSRASGRAF